MAETLHKDYLEHWASCGQAAVMLTKQCSGYEYNQHAAFGTSLQERLLQLKGGVDPGPSERKHGGVIASIQIPLYSAAVTAMKQLLECISGDTCINTAS